ncbi:hypothetical protein Hte_010437 [Hypoxylon texense]
MKPIVFGVFLAALTLAAPLTSDHTETSNILVLRDGTTEFDTDAAFKAKRDGTTEFDPDAAF